MTFRSVLFARSEDGERASTAMMPSCFCDLNLDQVVDAITATKNEYNLKPFFYVPLRDVDSILFRYEVMQDLGEATLFSNLRSFAEKMRTMREHLARSVKTSYKYQHEWWCLEAVNIYCDAIDCLLVDLSAASLQSRGLAGFREYVKAYAQSKRFTELHEETTALKVGLDGITYGLLLRQGAITVQQFQSEGDYSEKIEEAFRRFKQGSAKEYLTEFPEWQEMNHIEEQILNYVALLNPHVFSRLNAFCASNGSYLDATIGTFDREIQFYVAYLEYASTFISTGLPFCYAKMSDTCKEVHDSGVYDWALAARLIKEKASIVCNDFYLKGSERIIVVSGPNQGGKTTFSRTFGQVHYLAALGCPVPGKEAQLFVFDGLFTHFEKEESIETLRGKLEDDLVRIHDILKEVTSNSIVIMNEIFTSTTLQDQIFLSKNVMAKLVGLDLLCVWVTFIDELASYSEQTVSMVSTIVPDNPAIRTFRIERKPPNGLAYAMSIVEKYRLTPQLLKERIQS
jgi:DNA mismatch repair protein MutS